MTKHGLQALGAVALAVLSFASPIQAQPAPVASVTGGSVLGAMIQDQAVFKSIPFAAPPVGALRWSEPQPPTAWTGTLDATRFPKTCVQSTGAGSEDCLYLNIWAPEWPAAERPKPVMIWFHGGGNTDGGTDTPLYYGASLAKHGVVVVTAQYRLGILGFFAHRELTQESPHHASGNYALLDQIAAINWVRDNIAAFGGDPANITIFGESAGAEDVGLLLVSPLTKGMFQRAIAQSGPLRRIYPSREEQEQACAALAEAMDAPERDQIAFLRAQPASAVVAATSREPDCKRIAIDGHVLQDQPLKLYAQGKQHPVPFMLGNTLREGFSTVAPRDLRATIHKQYGDLEDRVIDLYLARDPLYGSAAVQYGTDQAHRCRVALTGLQHQKIGAPFYQFEFARNLPGRAPDSSTHADDLAYTFGEPSLRDWGLESAVDRSLSDQMQFYWTNFAKTGNPNGRGVPLWPAFDPEKRAYMSLAVTGAAAGEGLRRAQCDLFLEAETSRPTWEHPERAPR